jgi:cytochrome P450
MLDVDVLDPAIYARGIPYAAFARLRAESPVHWHPEPGGRGFWAITKYVDIVRISRDPATFSSQRGATFVHDPHDPEDLTVMQLMMLNMDPPQHVRFRNIVKHGFVPKMLAAVEPRIRRTVREIVDRVAERGACEFVSDVAAELPLQVIADMIGVPEEDRHQIYAWTNRLVRYSDPDFAGSIEDARAAAMDIFAYAGELAQRRFENPGEDLISVLMRSAVDGGLSPMEFASFFMLLIFAGNETTRNSISGGMLALIEHPEERMRLGRQPELLPSAVEEMFRFVTPLVHMRRTATREVELRGRTIRENDKVVMFYPSANRDEEVFREPDRFDIGRHPNDHLAFGIGQHVCLGLNLARLEVRLLFEEVLARLHELELTGPVERARSNFVNTISSMPVRFAAAQKRALP